ncbi:hypothetical protein OAA34_00085 [bacterium]|nr:hypothetical protein [bacterium]
MWYINGNDLPIRVEHERNVVFDWDHGCESPKLFEEWKKDPKMDPIYLDESNPVKYELNSYGYRCKDFSEYEDGKFILAIGCSHTYGTGLHNEHIWCNQLGNSLEIPVMNLGNGGFGPDYIYMISTTYAHNKKYPKPAAVVIQWPGRYRKSFAYSNSVGIHLDPTHPEYEDIDKEDNVVKRLDYRWYFRRYIVDDAERIRQNHYNFLSIQKLWKSWGVDVINYSFENDYIEGGVIHPDVINMKTEHTGYARDMSHDGPDTHKQIANKLEVRVNKCLDG